CGQREYIQAQIDHPQWGAPGTGCLAIFKNAFHSLQLVADHILNRDHGPGVLTNHALDKSVHPGHVSQVRRQMKCPRRKFEDEQVRYMVKPDDLLVRLLLDIPVRDVKAYRGYRWHAH